MASARGSRSTKQSSSLSDEEEIDTLDAEYAAYFSGVVEFGKLLTGSLFLINAGALVAIPAYAQIFKDTIRSPVITLGITAILFALGLLFAGISGLCSYRCYFISSSRNQYERRFATMNMDVQAQAVASNQDERKRTEEKISRLRWSAHVYYKASHILGWCSILGFLLGCLFFSFSVTIT